MLKIDASPGDAFNHPAHVTIATARELPDAIVVDHDTSTIHVQAGLSAAIVQRLVELGLSALLRGRPDSPPHDGGALLSDP